MRKKKYPSDISSGFLSVDAQSVKKRTAPMDAGLCIDRKGKSSLFEFVAR